MTFHDDGLTIFWKSDTGNQEALITFLKPTEIVKSIVTHSRFFTVLNYYSESEIIEWDWQEKIFKTIAKYDKIITTFTTIKNYD